jgi:hypothetical protein
VWELFVRLSGLLVNGLYEALGEGGKAAWFEGVVQGGGAVVRTERCAVGIVFGVILRRPFAWPLFCWLGTIQIIRELARVWVGAESGVAGSRGEDLICNIHMFRRMSIRGGGLRQSFPQDLHRCDPAEERCRVMCRAMRDMAI